MLKYSPFVWRDQYAAVIDEMALVREMAMTRIQEAEEKHTITRDLLSQAVKRELRWIAERDDAHAAHTAAVDRELIAQELLTRALTQLAKVDPKRTGGVPMREAIANILKDATEHGLWEELPTKE